MNQYKLHEVVTAAGTRTPAERPWQTRVEIKGVLKRMTGRLHPKLAAQFHHFSTRNVTRAIRRTELVEKYTEVLTKRSHWADLVGLEEKDKRAVRNAQKRKRRGQKWRPEAQGTVYEPHTDAMFAGG